MMDIRTFQPQDRPAITAFYPQAFPDEDLVPLLQKLLDDTGNVVNLVALRDGAVIGHVAFTRCGIGGRTERLGLLGPLAVAPQYQKQGIGSALVRSGMERVGADGVTQVFVLGDPDYYSRFGFVQENKITPPYDLPEQWRPGWQSVMLGAPGHRPEGPLSVPEPWRERALWLP